MIINTGEYIIDLTKIEFIRIPNNKNYWYTIYFDSKNSIELNNENFSREELIRLWKESMLKAYWLPENKEKAEKERLEKLRIEIEKREELELQKAIAEIEEMERKEQLEIQKAIDEIEEMERRNNIEEEQGFEATFKYDIEEDEEFEAALLSMEDEDTF